MHVFHGDGSAHQAQQPSIKEALCHYAQIAHMIEQIVHLIHDDIVYDLTMHSQLLEISKIDHAQLLVFHHLDQGPKGQTLIFYMVEQDTSDHVHPLNIPHLYIVYTVCSQHLLQHHPKIHIFRKCRTLRMRPR